MSNEEEYKTFARLAAFHLREAQGAMLRQVRCIDGMIAELEKPLPEAPGEQAKEPAHDPQ